MSTTGGRPRTAQRHKRDDWYYCQYHKYNDPDSTQTLFQGLGHLQAYWQPLLGVVLLV